MVAVVVYRRLDIIVFMEDVAPPLGCRNSRDKKTKPKIILPVSL
jgi:hypothetical protein